MIRLKNERSKMKLKMVYSSKMIHKENKNILQKDLKIKESTSSKFSANLPINKRDIFGLEFSKTLPNYKQPKNSLKYSAETLTKKQQRISKIPEIIDSLSLGYSSLDIKRKKISEIKPRLKDFQKKYKIILVIY